MPRALVFAVSLAVTLAGAADGASAAEALSYPESPRGTEVDLLHGREVQDPYRWLEQDVREAPEVAAWVEAQNRLTFSFLERIPERGAIRQRLEELWDYERYSTPFKAGGRYYYFKNDGLQDQSVLYRLDRLEDEPQVLLDPNRWSPDGTVALTETSFSDDGRYVAYGVAEAGSDWRTWRVMEIASGELLHDDLRWIKFGGVDWTADSKGFFYSRYDAPGEGEAYQALNLNQKVYYHRVDTDQSEDILVYKRPDEPTWGFSPTVTEDGRFLVLTIWKGTDSRHRIAYKDLTQPYGMPVDLIEDFDHEFTFVGNDGHVFYFQTELEAPRRRVIAVDVRRPAPEDWIEVLAETEDTLAEVDLVANLFVATYLKDASTLVRIYSPAGDLIREVRFPGLGSASGFRGRRADTETFYSFSSFATPPSVYRYDLLSGESTLFREPEVAFDPDDFEVEQVFFTSKDGTRVPMFLAHKRGLERDGDSPTLLYGYGGFDIAQKPSFRVNRLAWIEMGGVFALANLRGGGEYGEAWHKAGTRLQKQNVFDDYIAAAEWLIGHGYTSPKKLAIQGSSNGGLLVGAAMTQRPDLFAAALPAVGVMDMLRFHRFTAGRFWVDDYGSAEDPEEFEALLAYSPYHNLKSGVSYPPTLVTTADHDDRVVPGHSFKFAAALQHAQGGQAPVLIRVETRAGHGSGKPTSKRIDEAADLWAFLVQALEMEVEGPASTTP